MNIERKASAGMLCPACQVPLVMSERQSIEIDYCPQCRGVWLDRGELDKIIERTGADLSARSPEGRDRDRYDSDRGRDKHHDQGYGHGGYRRKSWLKEIFD